MQKSYMPPVPRDQFAKMIDRSLAWIRVLIHEGRLPALELIQDKKTLESILVPYTSGKAKQQSLFISPFLAEACQKVMSTREARPRGVKGPRGKFLTDEELEAIVKQGTNDNSNILVPVPLSHLSKRVGLNIPTLSTAVKEGTLQAVEFKLDASNNSKLVSHTPRPMRGNALYVLPDEAQRFVVEEQRKRAVIGEAVASQPTMPIEGRIPTDEEWEAALRDGTIAAYDPSQGTNVPYLVPIEETFKQKVLAIAQQLKEQSGGTVERIKILEALSGGKRNNMYLYKKIKYVMDQHLDEFPPHRSGPHAFLTREVTKGK